VEILPSQRSVIDVASCLASIYLAADAVESSLGHGRSKLQSINLRGCDKMRSSMWLVDRHQSYML
jgi:hypothetical protein